MLKEVLLKYQNNSGNETPNVENDLTLLNLNYEDNDKSITPNVDNSQHYDDINEYQEMNAFKDSVKKIAPANDSSPKS